MKRFLYTTLDPLAMLVSPALEAALELLELGLAEYARRVGVRGSRRLDERLRPREYHDPAARAAGRAA